MPLRCFGVQMAYRDFTSANRMHIFPSLASYIEEYCPQPRFDPV